MKKNLIIMRRRVICACACACTLLKVSAMEPWQQNPGQDLTQPAPAQSPPVPAPSVEVTEWNTTVGVDTMGEQGRGDWFRKRAILRAARQLNQEIRKQVEQVQDAAKNVQGSLGTQLDQLDKALGELGVSDKEVEHERAALTTAIETFSAKDQVDRQKLLDLSDTKKMLDEFHAVFTQLLELRNGISQAMNLAQQKLESSLASEKEAARLYELIDESLNDHIAQQYLDEIQSISDHITQLESYIRADLKAYGDRVVQSFTEQKEKVSAALSTLQEREIFKKPEPETVETSQKPVHVKQSWWQIIFKPFIWLWSFIRGLINRIF